MEHFVWDIDPVLIHLGALQVRWYGLLFVGSFFLGAMILRWIYKREGKDPSMIDNLMLYVMIGAIIGSRLMHCFAYEPEFYLSHPLEIFKVWKGGLASHGGLLGVLIALYVFAKRYNQSYVWLLSRMTIPGALASSFVRFGNLFNSEILGIPSDVPWAMVFKRVDLIARHPVQLYEALSYLTLFFILLIIYRRVTPTLATKILPGIFLIFLFTARFIWEFFKTKQASYATDISFSTGQILSIPYILIGIVWIVLALKTQNKTKEHL